MSFPNMNDAFWEWTSPVRLQIVQKAIVDYQETEKAVIQDPFDGVLEPLHPRQLLIKPEGQRNWKWWELWTEKMLKNSDIVIDDQKRQYRVMNMSDWSNGGYQHYELVQDPPLGS